VQSNGVEQKYTADMIGPCRHDHHSDFLLATGKSGLFSQVAGLEKHAQVPRLFDNGQRQDNVGV
jgi:hypothetical protein